MSDTPYEWPNGSVPEWITEANEAMKLWGIEPEHMLARALMLGLTIEPYSNSSHPTARWMCTTAGGTGLVGETPEQLAFRYMYMMHINTLPLQVIGTCRVMDSSKPEHWKSTP